MNEYSMMTQELQDLAALSMEHGQIPSGLYDQYHVLRGLRDVNGKGVLAGLTDISTITSSKEVDGKMVPCDGELRYRGYDIHDLVDGFVAEQRFGYEEVAYLLIFWTFATEAGITGIPESSWKLSYIADELCARRYYESTR